MAEIELCPDCYWNSCVRKNDEWFTELCVSRIILNMKGLFTVACFIYITILKTNCNYSQTCPCIKVVPYTSGKI